jgi:hypothetical protein
MKDNLEGCGVSIHVQYTKNKYSGEDRLAEEVNHFTLYVFDSNGTFVGEYPSRGTLYNGYTLSLSLKSGVYDFVVWGNVGDDYEIVPFVKGQTKETEASLSLKRVVNNIVTGAIDSLYYGSLSAEIKPALLQDQVYTIDLIKDTKKIKVTAIGLPITETKAEESFACFIRSLNAGLRFKDNGVVGANTVQYEPVSAYVNEEKHLISDFVVMREIQDRSTNSRLVFTRSKEGGATDEILNMSLIDMMLEYIVGRVWTLDVEDEFNIEVLFTDDHLGGYMTSSITINGWEYPISNVIL